MWDRVEDRLALLELLSAGRLTRRAAQQAAFAWLSELSWTRAGARRDELTLVAERREELVALLGRVWPAWGDAQLALVVAGEPPTPTGWRRLADRERAATLSVLPARLNRRTAAAATAPGAKSTLTASRQAALGEVEVTGDGVARVRPPPGLVARRGDVALPLDPVVAVLGEVGFSGRALRDGLVLDGAVEAVLLVENLGAWRDLLRPGRWMFVHVPGWNTATVLGLLRALGDVPVVNFGDLDPNGVRIHRHLRARVPGLGWLVPAFWEELVPLHAQVGEWPDGMDLGDAPELVRRLAREGRWMEQERVVLDARMEVAIREELERVRAWSGELGA